jgi:ABC-2 type transport system permease protein
MTAADYILGYTLPLLPMALGQALICYGAAVLLGLPLTAGVFWCVVLSLPVSLFFIALGLLCGSVFNDKQVGGICGAALTNLTVWLSGTFFDLDLVGGGFRAVAYALPFVHGVELEKAVLAGQWAEALPHLWWVLGYGLGATALAVLIFMAKRRKN